MKFSLPVWINGYVINGLWIGSVLGIGCYGPKPEHETESLAGSCGIKSSCNTLNVQSVSFFPCLQVDDFAL